jgi:hypothetical protein
MWWRKLVDFWNTNKRSVKSSKVAPRSQSLFGKGKQYLKQLVRLKSLKHVETQVVPRSQMRTEDHLTRSEQLQESWKHSNEQLGFEDYASILKLHNLLLRRRLMVNYATKSTSFQFGKELLCLAHSDASSALPRLKVLPLPTCYLFLLLPPHPYFLPCLFSKSVT